MQNLDVDVFLILTVKIICNSEKPIKCVNSSLITARFTGSISINKVVAGSNKSPFFDL